MSTTLRIGYLRLLQRMGRKSLIARSVFKFPYRISVGDMFSENPFYNQYSNVGEVLATAAWVADKPNPVVFDIGAHCGFIASQVAQILRKNKPVIYSFEPVAPTFSDLVQTVVDLSLHDMIHPVPIALSDTQGFVRLSYSKWSSMLSQIIPEGAPIQQSSATEVYFAPSQTIDEFCKLAAFPDVIKIDVEGWEVHVFEGARMFLESHEHQGNGICLEWNPEALQQTGSSTAQLFELLKNYRFFYLNDYEAQRLPELEEVPDPLALQHVCNLFVMVGSDQQADRWKSNFRMLKDKFKVTVG